MKKLLFVLGVILSLCLGSSALAEELKVSVNGEVLETEAVLIDNRTMVPLRAISNALGGGVAWDQETMGILIVRAGTKVEGEAYLVSMWIDKPRAFCLFGNGISHGTIMDVAPTVIDNRTFIPARAVSELFGAEVNWNPETFTAEITADEPLEIASDEFAEQILQYEQALYIYYDVYDRYLNGDSKTVNAEIVLENDKKIEVELYPEIAPETVANFVKLAEEDYYNGLIFHRVIEDFMIQGGGLDKTGNERQTETITGEFLANGLINFLPHKRGVLSMARTMQSNNSATGQFFIMHKDGLYLDGEYASFGMVTGGMEIVDEIASVKTDENDKPVDDVVIKEINIIE